MDMFEQMKAVVGAFETAGVGYALCGGLAMAVHAAPRATIDLDFLIAEASVETAVRTVEALGFRSFSDDMVFQGGAVRILRRIKFFPGEEDPLILDLLPASGPLEDVFRNRQSLGWEAGKLWVVSCQGLIRMKRMRSSPQDLADIAVLSGMTDDRP